MFCGVSTTDQKRLVHDYFSRQSWGFSQPLFFFFDGYLFDHRKQGRQPTKSGGGPKEGFQMSKPVNMQILLRNPSKNGTFVYFRNRHGDFHSERNGEKCLDFCIVYPSNRCQFRMFTNQSGYLLILIYVVFCARHRGVTQQEKKLK